jgi:hypothetical protein
MPIDPLLVKSRSEEIIAVASTFAFSNRALARDAVPAVAPSG